jgi:hypothetical protein
MDWMWRAGGFEHGGWVRWTVEGSRCNEALSYMAGVEPGQIASRSSVLSLKILAGFRPERNFPN